MSVGASGDKVLVTGATGLLGSHLAERIIARDIVSEPWSGPAARPIFWIDWASKSYAAI